MQMEPHAHSWSGCGWTHTLRTMAHAARVWFFMTLSVLLALIVLLHAGPDSILIGLSSVWALVMPRGHAY